MRSSSSPHGLTGSMTLTVPPTSEETQSSEPSLLNTAKRGLAPTSTLATISWVFASMKCAMLLVSEVQITNLPSGLTAIPSGSTPTWMLAVLRARFHIDDRDGVIVLVGDVEKLAAWTEGEELRIGTGWQIAGDFLGLRVDDLDRVVVASRNDYRFAILGYGDAARALANLDGLDHLQLVRVDDADCVALLVRNISFVGAGRMAVTASTTVAARTKAVPRPGTPASPCPSPHGRGDLCIRGIHASPPPRGRR